MVDSPGLNENKDLDDIVFDYLPQTIGVICVINAGQGVTTSLKKFLAKVASLDNYSPKQVFFVITHWDLMGEKERDEFLKGMHLKIKEVLPNYEKKNFGKVNLKAAFKNIRLGVHNQDYKEMMNELLPFFKSAFKLKLQKKWISIKEVLRYSNDVVRAIYNKTQDTLEKSNYQSKLLLQAVNQFETNGELQFKEFNTFLRETTRKVREEMQQIIKSKEAKEIILKRIKDEPIPKNEEFKEAIMLEAWLENTMRKKLIEYISCEKITKIFIDSQETIKSKAANVFGQILFDLNTFEQKLNGSKEVEEKPSLNPSPQSVISKPLEVFNTFTTETPETSLSELSVTEKVKKIYILLFFSNFYHLFFFFSQFRSD